VGPSSHDINQLKKRKSEMIRHTNKTLNGLLYALIAICLFSLTLANPMSALAASSMGNGPPSFADLAERVRHSVVNISTTQVVEGSPLAPFFGLGPFGNPFKGPGSQPFHGDRPHKMETHALGSGFIISADGLILTNDHVVEKATEIKIKLDTDKEYEAKIIGKDPKTDLALLKVETDTRFPNHAVLGDSDAMRVGDWVMAVGNPFGLGHTVTTGIISAKGRVIGAGPYDDFIQTDAAINPGNSGGPLFNMKGEVIGINTAIVAQGQGIGFAIPSNIAKNLLPQLKTGKISRGWLGLMIQNITPELAKSFHLTQSHGALISQVVKGSPAEKAGLKPGDVITEYDGKAVKNSHTLSQMAADTPPGKSVTLTIFRAGEAKTVQLTVGEMSEKGESRAPEKEPLAWGMAVETLTPDVARHLDIDPAIHGVVITDIDAGSPASEAGLQKGDVITDAASMRVSNLEEFHKALNTLQKGDNLLLRIQRGAGAMFVVLKPNSTP
jgi:serine protease Do